MRGWVEFSTSVKLDGQKIDVLLLLIFFCLSHYPIIITGKAHRILAAPTRDSLIEIPVMLLCRFRYFWAPFVLITPAVRRVD